MENKAKYSIIIVCLNPGNRIIQTLASVYRQSFIDYEVIIKDGGSTDGSLNQLFDKVKEAAGENATLSIEEFQRKVSVYTTLDQGIYDAMNQAVTYASGEYYLFMNAGDDLYDHTTLEKITSAISNSKPDLFYGNLYHKALDTVIYASPEINDFTCYRNVPCHQTCFYHHSLFEERGYDTKYNVRADYEHFLWCFYEKKADMKYVPMLVASYEGGGYSETRENRKRSAKQHREIVLHYMGRKKANHFRMIMWLTLAPLRSKIAENRFLSPVYNFVKTSIYRCRKRG